MEVSLHILHGRLKSAASIQNVGVFTIRQSRFVIGNDAECNMVCRSRLVSARHCEIRLSDHEITITDLGSEFGTFVNGVRVERPMVLKTGDLLKIGRLEFFISIEPQHVAPPSSIEPPAPTAHDTVTLSAAGSETLVDGPPLNVPAGATDGIDDLVSELLMGADEKERELRKSDPAARYLRVESPAPTLNEPETPVTEQQAIEAKKQRLQRPVRKPPIKLPADKRRQPLSINGKDSVGAAEQALQELFRSPKKK